MVVISTAVIVGIIVVLAVIGTGVGVGVYFWQQSINQTIPPSSSTRSPTVSRSPTFSRAPTPPTTRGPTTLSPTFPPSTGISIQLSYLNTLTTAQQQLFESAKTRWTGIITKGYSSTVKITQGQTFCSVTAPATVTVTDLLIYVQVSPIDGVGKILGQAGPLCFEEYNKVKQRANLNDYSAQDSQGRIRVGSMQFDSADIDQMISGGTAASVILHEMNHVFGFGTIWEAKNLINPSLSAAQTPPFYYTGANGNLGNQEIGGGSAAVVEDAYGEGTARGHWKESTYEDELMTGFISGTPDPLSRLTIRSLADLGYTVDPSKADSYTVPPQTSGRRRLRKSKIPYGNDIMNHKVKVIESIPKPGWEKHLNHTETRYGD